MAEHATLRGVLKRKPVVAWAFYDWANSAFATTIMAGLFPVFYSAITQDLSTEDSQFWFNVTLGGRQRPDRRLRSDSRRRRRPRWSAQEVPRLLREHRHSHDRGARLGARRLLVDGARALRARHGRLLGRQRVLRLHAGRRRRGRRARPGLGARILGWLHRRWPAVRAERAHGAEAGVVWARGRGQRREGIVPERLGLVGAVHRTPATSRRRSSDRRSRPRPLEPCAPASGS